MCLRMRSSGRRLRNIVSGKSKKWLTAILLIFCAPMANAGLTVANGSSVVVDCAWTLSLDVDNTSGLETIQTNEPLNSHLSAIAAEFREAPFSFASPTSVPVDARSLPTVPGALSMVAIGFFCVSLVKDRRIWLAGLAGLVWTGQAGTNVLPQLALHLSHGNNSKRQSYEDYSGLACQHHPEDSSNRLRSDIEGTKYIGLLHRLAGIPDADDVFTDKRLAGLIIHSPQERKLYAKAFSYYGNNKHKLQTIIASWRYSLNLLLNCPAVQVGWFNCFSPAFIFKTIPRGPPKLAGVVTFL